MFGLYPRNVRKITSAEARQKYGTSPSIPYQSIDRVARLGPDPFGITNVRTSMFRRSIHAGVSKIFHGSDMAVRPLIFDRTHNQLLLYNNVLDEVEGLLQWAGYAGSTMLTTFGERLS